MIQGILGGIIAIISIMAGIVVLVFVLNELENEQKVRLWLKSRFKK